MSWSFIAIGYPEKIAAALDEESGKQKGQCKIEFDDAKEHLKALVNQTFNNREGDTNRPMVKLEASGSGSADSDGKQTYRNCSVKIESFWAKLLI